MQHPKKVCKAFLRRKLIYSISTLECSICAGVFNVNPQSGIEFPSGGRFAAYCATKKQSNQWTYGAPVPVHNKKARGVHSQRTFCVASSSRIYTQRNKLDRPNRSNLFFFPSSSDAACLSCKDIRRFGGGIKGIFKNICIFQL